MGKGLYKMLDAIGFGTEEEDIEEEASETQQDTLSQDTGSMKPLKTAKAKKTGTDEGRISSGMHEESSQVCTHFPKPQSARAEAKKICTELRESKTVIVNMKNLSDTDSLRLYDFICGSVYALDGEIKEVGEKIMLIVPQNTVVYMEDEEEENDDDGFLTEDYQRY